MDEKELQKNIALYYSKLPPRLQEIFSSMEWLEELKKIAAKYTLGEEQIKTLGTETTLLLLGIIHPDEYYEALDQQLGLFRDNLEKMIAEINSSVVNIIHPELVEAFDKNVEPETEEVLDKRFDKLPAEVQDTIRKMDYHATLYKIAEEYKLIIPQTVELEKITTNVMLGTIRGDQFERTVKENLKLPDDKNKELVSTIIERILNKIRGRMMQAYNSMPNTTTIPVKIIQPETKEEKQANTQVLSEHGIEIVSDFPETPKPQTVQVEKLELATTPTSPVQNTPILNKASEQKPIIVPEIPKIPKLSILTQKFAGSVSMPSVKTEHTLPNITPPSSAQNKPTTDPYREIPE